MQHRHHSYVMSVMKLSNC